MSSASVEQPDAGEAPNEREHVVATLTARLAATPRGMYPYQHATIAYRLGLAYAESPGSNQTEGLRRALAYYDVAAGVFDPALDPVPHARVLNAAGAAHRALGDRRQAADLFETASRLLAERGRDDERAAAFNNLGLVLTELGEPARAVEACNQAVELFDASTAEGRRGRVAALHARGLAHAAGGDEEGLGAAVADYRDALTDLDASSAPYHYAIVHDSLGAASVALAELRPDQRERLLGDGVQAFLQALTVFTRGGFPYQHALVKHNLGLALLGLGTTPGHDDPVDLRWSLACFEDTVALLDPRVQVAEWRLAYSNLKRAEDGLSSRGLVGTRADNFVALLIAWPYGDPIDLLRERLTRMLMLPDPQRDAAMAELALASARLGYDGAHRVATAEMQVLMELPTEHLEAGLRARFAAHLELTGESREEADRAWDQAVGDSLVGPQRMHVRDFLYSLGWERP